MVYRVHGFGVTDVQQVLQGRGKKKRTRPLRISSESPSGESYDYALHTIRYVGGAQVSSLQV